MAKKTVSLINGFEMDLPCLYLLLINYTYVMNLDLFIVGSGFLKRRNIKNEDLSIIKNHQNSFLFSNDTTLSSNFMFLGKSLKSRHQYEIP